MNASIRFCDRPTQRGILPHFHRRKLGSRSPGSGYSPVDVCAAYNFPRGVPVAVAPVIAIVELGGGYIMPDVVASFARMGLPAPNIVDLSVDGASNSPGDEADGEVALDIQVAAAAYSYCTGQPANVLMLWAQNTDSSFANAIAAAGKAGASTVSISWGAPESAYGASALQAMEQGIGAALAAGATVFAASGDNDANDGTGHPVTDYPAASPGVIGCGGTRLTPSAETVWNDGQNGTGGGFSKRFAKPQYQMFSGSWRGVPDMAGNADPATGYQILVDGQWGVIGGTSAVAPLYAGLIAACKAAAQTKGVQVPGNILPLLYRNAGAFRDITVGNNNVYQAGPGWDPNTGLGSPNGAAILAAFLAGAPVVPPPPPPPPPPVTPPGSPWFITISGTGPKPTIVQG